MDTAQATVLKEQLKAIAAGHGDGIALDTPERWVIEDIRDRTMFFKHLGLLIPADSILYIEGADIASDVAKFYEAHRAVSGAARVMRDMICPVPETFHLRVGPELIHGLIDMAARHPQERCFFHLKAYRDEKLLFAFHDAFDGSPLLVSERVEPERIKAFSQKFGLSYRREQNEQKRDVEVLQRLLSMMEDPAKVRMLWPWWKRALLFWKK